MEDQQRLFTGALEAAIWSCRFVPGSGWTVRLQLRRQFEDWSDAREDLYEGLTTDELGDVLDSATATLWAHLGL